MHNRGSGQSHFASGPTGCAKCGKWIEWWWGPETVTRPHCKRCEKKMKQSLDNPGNP